MSKNSISQNEKEINCLKYVMDNLNQENSYGLSETEFYKVSKLIESAQANESSSKFPDFIIKHGFIEHFQVTSSKSTRKKGSDQIRDNYMFKETAFKNFREYISEADIPKAYYESRKMLVHSQNYLRNSIKENIEKHLVSYSKFEGEKEHSIFLLEYSDSMLETAEIFPDKPSIIHNTFKLSLDKELLNWISELKNQIEYIIFVTDTLVEIIKVRNIHQFINEIPQIIVESLHAEQTHSFHPITFKLQ